MHATRREGPTREEGYWYPGSKLINYYKSLRSTNRFSNVFAEIDRPVVVMTHDDFYDQELSAFEAQQGLKSTYFLLSYKVTRPRPGKDQDVQLHFDKAFSRFDNQLKQFQKAVGKHPLANRMHRLWWRSDNIDLAFLAMKGMKIDSTKIGVIPYRPCVQGRILPIWEVPFSVCDSSVERRVTATYRLTSDPETLFTNDISPIVALYHPYAVVERQRLVSDHNRFCELVKKYGYTSLTITELYERFLRPMDKEVDGG